MMGFWAPGKVGMRLEASLLVNRGRIWNWLDEVWRREQCLRLGFKGSCHIEMVGTRLFYK